MATIENTQKITMTAGADLSSSRYRFVKIASDAQVDVAGNDATAEGVLEATADAAGKAISVIYSGVAKVICGANITTSININSNTNNTATGTGSITLNITLKTKSTKNIIQILLK